MMTTSSVVIDSILLVVVLNFVLLLTCSRSDGPVYDVCPQSASRHHDRHESRVMRTKQVFKFWFRISLQHKLLQDERTKTKNNDFDHEGQDAQAYVCGQRMFR